MCVTWFLTDIVLNFVYFSWNRWRSTWRTVGYRVTCAKGSPNTSNTATRGNSSTRMPSWANCRKSYARYSTEPIPRQFPIFRMKSRHKNPKRQTVSYIWAIKEPNDPYFFLLLRLASENTLPFFIDDAVPRELYGLCLVYTFSAIINHPALLF